MTKTAAEKNQEVGALPSELMTSSHDEVIEITDDMLMELSDDEAVRIRPPRRRRSD